MSAHRRTLATLVASTPLPRRSHGAAPLRTVSAAAEGGLSYGATPVPQRAPRVPRRRPSILDLIFRNLLDGTRP